jgi:hypothetical protein
MKKVKLLLLIAALGVLTVACNFGRRRTTIVETGNNHYIKIESMGTVDFNTEKTAISYISPGGYLNYEYNDNKLKAVNDGHGGVHYELDADGEKLDPAGNGKAFIAEAVKVMIKKGYRSN